MKVLVVLVVLILVCMISSTKPTQQHDIKYNDLKVWLEDKTRNTIKL